MAVTARSFLTAQSGRWFRASMLSFERSMAEAWWWILNLALGRLWMDAKYRGRPRSVPVPRYSLDSLDQRCEWCESDRFKTRVPRRRKFASLLNLQGSKLRPPRPWANELRAH